MKKLVIFSLSFVVFVGFYIIFNTDKSEEQYSWDAFGVSKECTLLMTSKETAKVTEICSDTLVARVSTLREKKVELQLTHNENLFEMINIPVLGKLPFEAPTGGIRRYVGKAHSKKSQI